MQTEVSNAQAPPRPNVANGEIGQTEVTQAQHVELDHSIGFSGSVLQSVHLHPQLKEYVLIAGSSIVVRDILDPHNQHFLTAHDDQVTCLAVSNNGTMLATGQRGENSDVVIWDFLNKKAIYRLSEHDHEVTNLAFSNDDRLLLSTGNQLDGKIFIWNTQNGHIVSSMNIIPQVFAQSPTSIAWGGFVKDVKLRPTTNYQFAMAGSKKLTLWALNPATGQCNYDSVGTGTMVREYICMTFSKNSEDFLFAGTTSGDFVGFQVKNKVLVFAINCVAQGVKTIVAVDQEKVCVGGGDGQAILFQLNGKDTS